VTIGNFDGVHRGHQAIVEQVRRLADQVSGPAVVFTFDPPPSKILRPDSAPSPLTSIERRTELLKGLGIDHVIVYPTNSQLLALEPEEFFETVVVQSLKAKAIAEGENFQFGKKRRGDVAMLRHLCQEQGLQFSLLQPQRDAGEWISSTRIRSLLESGDIANANRLLIEPYRISGIVGHGAERGRTLGFPTINLENIPVLCPPLGVYAGRVATSKCMAPTPCNSPSPIGMHVAINIGPNPTFGEDRWKVEAHIIDYAGNLYDHEVSIELISKLREVRKFDSKDQLLTQLASDIQQAKSVCSLSNKNLSH
jgi:riboflavin kinase/FMN adenylyltransferase